MNRRGITLVEVIVILLALGIIVALLLPSCQGTRNRDDARSQCQSQMRQIGIALHTAQDTYARMPAHCGKYPLPISILAKLKNAEVEGSTFFFLLPFLDQANLMLNFDIEGTRNSWRPGGPGDSTASPRIYSCPSDPSPTEGGMVNGKPACSYAVNLSVFWKGNEPIKIPKSMPNGPSVTAFVFERYALCGDVRNNPWGKADVGGANLYGKSDWVEEALYTTDGENPPSMDNPYKKFQHKPKDDICDPYTAHGPHGTGTNVLMGDASVKRVAPNISGKIWHAIITPNSRDDVGSDW